MILSKFIKDLFFLKKLLDIRTLYWGYYVNEDIWSEIKKNFNLVTSKSIKENYNNSGLDEFEYYLNEFMDKLEKNFTELSFPPKKNLSLNEKTAKYIDGTQLYNAEQIKEFEKWNKYANA